MFYVFFRFVFSTTSPSLTRSDENLNILNSLLIEAKIERINKFIKDFGLEVTLKSMQ